MEIVLSEEERKRMNKELVKWVDTALKGNDRIQLYNIILSLKRLVERKGKL